MRGEIGFAVMLLLPASSMSPTAARAWALRAGCPEHAVGLLDDALLLISELVTSAVVYGGPPIVLSIECDGDGLQVRLRDGSPTPPRQRSAGPDAESGRGMTLVGILTNTWGVVPVADDHGIGTEVWLELRRN